MLKTQPNSVLDSNRAQSVHGVPVYSSGKLQRLDSSGRKKEKDEFGYLNI